MSQLGSTERGPGIPVQKPRPDIYTVLLGLSLTAIIIAIIMLVLELGRYGWDYKAASVRLSMASPAQQSPMNFPHKFDSSWNGTSTYI
ncbi:MAG TPA: hypothetical protein VHD36_13575 [Pirellulales bacterium]|nr:hypothetical protein [Pirellulales bacterium]